MSDKRPSVDEMEKTKETLSSHIDQVSSAIQAMNNTITDVANLHPGKTGLEENLETTKDRTEKLKSMAKKFEDSIGGLNNKIDRLIETLEGLE
jgi:DNA repair ATPase RecN